MSSNTETLVESAPPKIKKSKKPTKVNPEDSPPQEVTADTRSSPPPSSKKRKREALPDEIEVDVAAPEPPSRKALRRLKKGKPAIPTATSLTNAAIQAEDDSDLDDTRPKKTTAGAGESKRSEYGVWIGNLPFAANPVSLREFLTAGEGISHAAITRIHMPVPHNATATRTQVKPQNKGFAYVDFTTKAAMDAAMALSETAIGGRKVLIKDARSYAGRPEKSKSDEAGGQTAGNAATGRTKAALEGVVGAPSKRVFVGNLDFAVTKEDLQELFGKCGTIEDVHMATFEDTGKCKGYAWIRFVEIEAAEAAVRGWLRVAEPGISDDEESASDEAKSEGDANADSDDSDSAEKKKQKKPKKAKKVRTRKWFVNRLLGRTLRCEFAEDASTRYRKRFGKDAASARENDRNADVPDIEEVNDGAVQNARKMGKKPGRGPARDIQPGAPTDPGRRRGRTGEDAPRREPNVGDAETRYRTGAIAEATGVKKTFD